MVYICGHCKYYSAANKNMVMLQQLPLLVLYCRLAYVQISFRPNHKKINYPYNMFYMHVCEICCQYSSSEVDFSTSHYFIAVIDHTLKQQW